MVTIHPLIDLHSVRFTDGYFSGISGRAQKNTSKKLTSSDVKISYEKLSRFSLDSIIVETKL